MIVNDDAIVILPLKVIVPITEWDNRYTIAAWLVRIESDDISGLKKTSAADAFQVRCVSQTRFVKQIGRLSEKEMQKIVKSLAAVFGIPV